MIFITFVEVSISDRRDPTTSYEAEMDSYGHVTPNANISSLSMRNFDVYISSPSQQERLPEPPDHSPPRSNSASDSSVLSEFNDPSSTTKANVGATTITQVHYIFFHVIISL